MSGSSDPISSSASLPVEGVAGGRAPDGNTPDGAAGVAHSGETRPEHDQTDQTDQTDEPDEPHVADEPDEPASPPGPVVRALGDMRAHLTHLERLCGAEVEQAESLLRPLWQGAIRGEHRLPVAAAVAVAIGLQVGLPNRLTMHPTWLLPALESALLIGLVAADPRRIERESRPLRTVSLVLIAVISIDNVYSAGHLIKRLIDGTMGPQPGPLLASGASIYMTNIIVFALWYWEFDRGGPVARLHNPQRYPDLLFPQMTSDRLAPPDWRATFFDYLYMSFTNATAFSPTDVLPLTRWAKALMAGQAGVSLATLALVVARAVNIFK